MKTRITRFPGMFRSLVRNAACFFACVHAKLEIQHGLITQVEATPDPGRAGAKSCLVCLDQTTAVIACYTVRYSSGFEAMSLRGH